MQRLLLSRQLWPPAYIQIVPSTQIADIQKRYLPVGMEWALSLEVVRDVNGYPASVRWIVPRSNPILAVEVEEMEDEGWRHSIDRVGR